MCTDDQLADYYEASCKTDQKISYAMAQICKELVRNCLDDLIVSTKNFEKPEVLCKKQNYCGE